MGKRSLAGALAAASLLAACGTPPTAGGFHPHGSAASPDATTGSSPNLASGPAADSTGGTPQSALAAYRSYQLAYEKAYSTSNPSVLDPVAMDPLLSQVTADITRVHAQGVIWRFHNVLNPRVQGRSADGSRVVILDCVRTLGAYRFDAKTGRRLGAWRGGSRFYQAIMRLSGNIWKISEARQGSTC